MPFLLSILSWFFRKLKNHFFPLLVFSIALSYLLWQRIPQYIEDQKLKGKDTSKLQLRDINGKTHSLAELKDRLLLLDFFGTWCRPCLLQLPSLEKLSRSIPSQQLSIFSISSERREVLKNFQEKRGIAYPIIRDGDDSLHRFFHVDSYPSLILIDRNGKIESIRRGFSPLFPYLLRFRLFARGFF